MLQDIIEPAPIPLQAQDEMREVLDRMSPGSLRRLVTEIESGHIDGVWYGGNLDDVVTEGSLKYKGRTFQGCFLGWAGFLEQRTVREVVDAIPGYRMVPHPTGVEDFVALIASGDTPTTSPRSAALYLFVSQYLMERTAPPASEEKQNGNA
jgi:hypothetical protein